MRKSQYLMWHPSGYLADAISNVMEWYIAEKPPQQLMMSLLPAIIQPR
jgi:hypothetical protein